MERRKRSNKWSVAKRMPPLQHGRSGEPFEVQNSEVVRWLISQPSIMQLIFDSVKDAKEIVYDSDTGTWRGTDYDN